MTDRITFAAKIEADGRRFRGSVTLAGSRTFRNGEWLEVDPKALMKADASDVVATIDHDPARVIGRTSNQTVSLNRSESGITFETADAPNTSYANDALELAHGGYFGGSSFTVDGLRSKFSYADDGLRVRTITHIKRLIDVSIVMDPAFANSSAAAFSKESDVTEPIAAPPPPAEAPPVTPPVADSPSQAAERFARTLETAQIESAMDNLMASSNGEMTGETLDQYEAFAKVFTERRKADTDTRERNSRAKALHDIRLGRTPKAPEAQSFTASDEYHEAFTNFLRTGDSRGMEQFAQAIAGDGTQGGYTVPDGFLNRVTETMKAYGGIQGISDSITTSDGQPLRWPSNDDTANSAAIATEGAAVGSGGADLIFGSVTLGAYSYDATGASNLPLLVSKELLQDAAIDIEAFIGRKLGERLGRKMAADFATANGSSKPLGLLAKTPDTMSATTAYAAFVEHFFQVDQAYRDSARWVMSDSVLTKIYNSLDDNGRPLFTPQAQASGSNAPAGFILGKPVTLDQGAGLLVAFGDIRLGYIIRYVRSVQIDVDPYTNIKSRQIAYHAWARADANVQDSAAYSVSDYTSVNADS